MPEERRIRVEGIEEALETVQDQVRKNPSDAKHRIYLFQLLSLRGEWERALNQLKVVGDLDAASLAMVQTYREALRCEALRAEVFSGRRSPLVFGEPAAWVAHMIEALRLTTDGQSARAQELRERAFEQAPAVPGTLDGQPFEWIADADSRLGPILEAVINGRYYWVPFLHISSLQVEEPADLRDLVWMPAYFTWLNGGEAAGLIPTRYPGSEGSADEAIQAARRTEWAERPGEEYHGLGQRMLATDAGEYALMDIRQVSLGGGSAPERDAGESPPSAER
jgi:type VI secretion system protein ImpE